jgi:AraC-like DNA-binding protein
MTESEAAARVYREIRPLADLAPDIACIWYDKRPGESRSQLVLPDGCVDIVWVRGREPLVAGPATLPVEAEVPSGATILGARLAPGRAPLYLGMPADALLNANVPLREVWPSDASRLIDELEASSSVDEGLGVLESALLRRMHRQPDGLVEAAVAELVRRPESAVSALSDGLGLSQRHLLRRFTAAVGYGPRVFGRVMRLRRFLTLVSRHAERDLTRLAVDAGFADHAHLVHECEELTGMTPSALRLRWSS